MKHKRNKKIVMHTKTNRVKGFFSTIAYKFNTMSFVRHLLLAYLAVTLVGTLLLMLPISVQEGVKVSFLDTLFTSASAFSDTGLVISTTSETWTAFGQGIIAILILLGGIGFFALKAYLFNILFIDRPLSISSRNTLAAERGSVSLGISRDMIKVSVTVLLILILIFSVVLSFYFFFTDTDMTLAGNGMTAEEIQELRDAGIYDMGESPYFNISLSIRYGLFHTISAINNAGFDIIGSFSLRPYHDDYFVQSVFVILFVIGGIGYPVMYDLYKWIASLFTRQTYRFSLFTKMSTLTYFGIAVIGLSLAYAFELSAKGGFWHEAGNGSSKEKLFAIFFNTMSTRNAGFATVDLNEFSDGTLYLYIMLMFIGSSPSSTAGGIRTTTLAIIMLGIWKEIRSRNNVRAFNRRIEPVTVIRAYIVFVTAVVLVTVGALIGLTSLQLFGGTIDGEGSRRSFIKLMFETASAFGTTGLSLGITPNLSVYHKLFLIILMFIGQLGVSSTLLVWGGRRNLSRKFSLVKEDITIG